MYTMAASTSRLAAAAMTRGQGPLQAQQEADANPRDAKGKGKLDDVTVAALKGWSVVPRKELVPKVYREKDGFLSKRATDAKQRLFKTGIIEWAKKWNKRTDIHRIRHDDTQMNNIAKENFLLCGGNRPFHTWVRGLGFSNCSPKRASVQSTEIQAEELANALGVVMWKKGDPPPPGSNYYEIMTTVWIHCGKLAVCLTKDCRLYQGLFGLGEVLESDAVRHYSEGFIPFFCAKLAYMI